MVARNRRASRWLSGLAEEADRFARVRVERLAAAARRQTDELAEHAGKRLAGMAAVLAAVVVAVGLLVSGLAGGLGELTGRAWVGQLLAGICTVTVVLAVLGASRAKARRREAAEALLAAQAAARAEAEEARQHEAEDVAHRLAEALGREVVDTGADMLRQHPMASMAAASAAGILAGSLLAARSNGRGSH